MVKVRSRLRRTPGSMRLYYSAPDDFLHGLCWKEDVFCPRCQSHRIYQLKEGRMRCGGCGYTFHDFCNRWLDRVKAGPARWIRLMEAFASMQSAREASHALCMSYNAAHKAMQTIRLAIMADGASPEELLRMAAGGRCEDCGHCREGGCNHCVECVFPVYAVNQSSLGVLLTRLRGVTPREVIGNPLAKRKWSVFIYTDRFKVYDGLLLSCCRNGRNLCQEDTSGHGFALEKDSGFWTRAREWLSTYGNIDPLNYPLYIKECEFRFNHRGEDLVPLLAERLCRFVPECKH